MIDDIHILLQGCIEYDRLSQEKLYRQLYPALFALCNKFFDEEDDIVTALNNGMLRVFNNIEKYNPAKGTLDGWIYSIVRNAAITLVRVKKNQMATEELSYNLQLETSINPFKDAKEETILAFLTKLNPATRAVFNLFYIEGFLIKEIAGSLDMQEGTVKWHLSEGRNKLKTIFKDNINARGYAK
ncbi:RNA polymerase sigma factor [Parasediminibacterium sp. JCM 36343]|uniref:RNA polymerase sigma factor n=1 Tax=Parasediminibacterium sp. JCM 36343 TaxID=3374279 RepID=UPI00397CAD42